MYPECYIALAFAIMNKKKLQRKSQAAESLLQKMKQVKTELLLIFISCFALNINTLQNNYALDDTMVILKNMNVQMGFGGIGKIMRTDAFQGYYDYYETASPIEGGRYRPLSIVTFAIEQQLFGKTLGKEYIQKQKYVQLLRSQHADYAQQREAENVLKSIEKKIDDDALELAALRHFFQILYFTLSMLILFWFLHFYLFPDKKNLALMTTLLFAFHPLHTEVVANLKSRDEIFSLLFLLLSSIYVFRYDKNPNGRNLFLASLCFWAALFSKEYAPVYPFVLASAMVIFNNHKLLPVLTSRWFLVFMALSALATLARFSIVAREVHINSFNAILNNSYLYATTEQALATKIAVLNEYLRLLLFPHPLSADYSYNAYPYLSFSHWKVWLSLLVWSGILVITIRLWQKKHPLAFACILFLAFFMMINNLLLVLGTPLSERLIYHSSLGFCLVAAWLLAGLSQKLSALSVLRHNAASVIMSLVLLPMAYKTIARNSHWQDDFTLFTTDAGTMGGSALIQHNAGVGYFDKARQMLEEKPILSSGDSVLFLNHADSAIACFDRCIAIHPEYASAFITRGSCYAYKGEFEQAAGDWKKAAPYFDGKNQTLSNNANYLLEKGKASGFRQDYKQAVYFMKLASEVDSLNAMIWETLGLTQLSMGTFQDAAGSVKKALQLNATSQTATYALDVANNLLDTEQALKQQPENKSVLLVAAGLFMKYGLFPLAMQTCNKVLSMEPGNPEALNMLREAEQVMNSSMSH